MKRFLLYIIALSVIIASCDDSYIEKSGQYATLTPKGLRVDNTEFFISNYNAVDVQNFEVISLGTPWVIENSVDWIEISPMSGDKTTKLHLRLSENTTAAKRIGVFYVKSAVKDYEFSRKVLVTQTGAAPYISLQKNEIEFSGVASTEIVSVTANCDYTIFNSDVWLTVNKTDNGISIIASANDTETTRTATVVLSYKGEQSASASLTVRQLPANITASTEQIVFNNTEGKITVKVNSESKWVAGATESWINVQPNSGEAGEFILTVSVSPNESVKERNGYVALYIGTDFYINAGQNIYIPIKQKGLYIDAEQNELSFTSLQSSVNLQIKSNVSWVISSVPEWLTVSLRNGSGDGEVEVTVSDNPSISERTGVIRITNEEKGMSLEIPVAQAGKTFDVASKVLNFEDKESSQTIDIKTDGKWTATTTDDWITLSPSTNTGNSVLTVTVAENTGDDERTGQITVVMGDQTSTVNVIQKGKYFTISDDALAYESKGGALNISISTNDTWTAKIEGSPSWLKLSNESGSGTIDITATAEDNPSVNSRSATIVFETKYSQSIKVQVTQKARFFSIDTYEVLFYAKGGASEAITISTDGKYKITCSETWFSITQTENIFSICATENTSLYPRTGSVTVELTDLKEGKLSATINVMQLNKGTSVFRQDFDEDNNYDIIITKTADVTKTEFGSDTDYDITINKSGDVSRTDFGSDTDYDITINKSGDVSRTDFGSDTNYDININKTGDVTKTEHGTDTNYDITINKTGDVSKTEFGADNNWD